MYLFSLKKIHHRGQVVHVKVFPLLKYEASASNTNHKMP